MSEIKVNLNSIRTWSQGRYTPAHSMKLPKELTDEYEKDERFLVRPSTRGNAICRTRDPGLTEWIAERLNMCSDLESDNTKLKKEVERLKEIKLVEVFTVLLCMERGQVIGVWNFISEESANTFIHNQESRPTDLHYFKMYPTELLLDNLVETAVIGE